MNKKLLFLALVCSLLIAIPIHVHADAPNPMPPPNIGYDIQAAHAVSEGAYFWVQISSLVSSGFDQFKMVFDPAFRLLFSIYVPFSEYKARLVTIPIRDWSTESSWVFAEFYLDQNEKMLFLFSAPNIEGNYSVYHFLFYKNDSENIAFPVCVLDLDYTQAIENILTREDLAKDSLLKEIARQNMQIQLMEKMFNFTWSDYTNDPSGYVNSLQHQLNETAYWKAAFSEKDIKLNLLWGVGVLALLFFGIVIVAKNEQRKKEKNNHAA